MDRTDEIIERLIRIEDNVCHLKKTDDILRNDGFPRCAAHGTKIDNLEKSQTFFKRGFFALIIGFCGKIIFDIFSV